MASGRDPGARAVPAPGRELPAPLRLAAGAVRVADPARALRLAVRAEDATTARLVLRRWGGSLATSGERDLVREGLRLARVRTSDPRLLVVEALLARAEGDVATALDLTHRVGSLAGARTRPGAPLAVLRLWCAAMGWARADDALATARALLGCAHDDAPGSHTPVGISMAESAWLMTELAALETWVGDLRSASVHAHEARRVAAVTGDGPVEAAALAHRAVVEIAHGAYGSAARTARAAELASRGAELAPGVAARIRLALGWGAVHALDLDGARRSHAWVVRRPEDLMDPVVDALTDLLEARILDQSGESCAASRIATARDALASTHPPFLRRLAAVTRAETAARCGASSAVTEAVAGLRADGFLDEARLFEAVLAASERPEPALRALDEVLRSTDLHATTAVTAAAFRMGLLLRTGDLERAESLLADLVGRAWSEQLLVHLAIVADLEPTFLPLLSRHGAARPRSPSAEVVAHLRRRRHWPDGEVAGTPVVADRALAGPESLTTRELDVLAGLASGSSYAEIGRVLFVSENTVKTHVSSLYRKLGVSRRVDAIRRATDLGLR